MSASVTKVQKAVVLQYPQQLCIYKYRNYATSGFVFIAMNDVTIKLVPALDMFPVIRVDTIAASAINSNFQGR